MTLNDRIEIMKLACSREGSNYKAHYEEMLMIIEHDVVEKRICLSTDEAYCVREGPFLKIHPLADTEYLFSLNSSTGELKGVGISSRDLHTGVMAGGVMTQKQAIMLRDLLNEWIETQGAV